MQRAPMLLGLLCLALCGGHPAAGLEQGLVTASGGRLALLTVFMGTASAEEAAATMGVQEGEEEGAEE
eukprot:CAMPEP_0204604178 /NCGR_PEP_ID=MMETSP0661-20131031/57702_1 /ASSEMBLY_ACC=CAM_ASM_000606 /TAXON_ID=109239 /ORGANISM="Alexandrium margalefi, Strain AMGDE01CS-322" /LENGTH=67 /DNA_ID=CAMNT_0051615311 /DNA_START=70 /DNA_END=270 /DNA_ORIENTATION=+